MKTLPSFTLFKNNPKPLFEIVRSIRTIITTDVVQAGIISNIHISAAKAKMAIILCCTTLSPSTPKKSMGTNQRKSVTAITSGRSTKYLTENFLSDIYFIFDYQDSACIDAKRRKFTK